MFVSESLLVTHAFEYDGPSITVDYVSALHTEYATVYRHGYHSKQYDQDQTCETASIGSVYHAYSRNAL